MRRILWLTLLPLWIYASPPQWQIIPAESQLTFTATQNDAPVTGEFKSFNGEIFVDPDDYKSSKITIIVDIHSLTVPYADLKETLDRASWFNSDVFPKAEFRATEFEKTAEKTYQAKGNLTIRDKTAPVTLTFTAELIEPNKGVVIGSTQVKRSIFGVGQGEWADTSSVKDEVTIHFKVVAVKK